MLYLDEKLVSTEEVLKQFGIPRPQRTIVFERLGAGAFSDINNAYISSGISFAASFPVVDNKGEQHFLEQLTSAPTKNGDKPLKRHQIDGGKNKKSFELQASQLEDYIVYYLHPNCADNKNKSTVKLWEIKDTEAESDAILSENDALYEALTIINDAKANIKKFRLLAKAMGYLGIDSMTDKEVRATLSKAVVSDAQQFLNKYNDERVMLKGRIIDAVDKNVIELRVDGGNGWWMWGKGSLKGTKLVVVRAGEDKDEVLLNYVLLSGEKMVDLLTYIKKAIDEENAKGAIENAKHLIEVEDETFAEQLINAGVLKIRDENVYFYKTSKVFQGSLEELNDHIASDKKLTSELESALQRKVTVAP